MRALSVQLGDTDATMRAGAAFGGALVPGMVVTLAGELGTGKTTFARGVLRGRGWSGSVKSPTFAVVEQYPLSNLYLYHFDFYRFEDIAEWDDAGIGDCFRDDTVCLVEWPERVAERLPHPDVAITLTHPAPGLPGRRLDAVATTEAGERCLTALAREIAITR
jgi:tRNA threonylcarbamoyladenosine biosynthesis protein TsaE